MRSEVIIKLDQNFDYWLFLRENPLWHRELTFHPEEFKSFLEDYKVKRRKRVVDRLEDLSLMVTLAKELM